MAMSCSPDSSLKALRFKFVKWDQYEEGGHWINESGTARGESRESESEGKNGVDHFVSFLRKAMDRSSLRLLERN